jgi:ligand-binding sensor domain-containing protein
MGQSRRKARQAESLTPYGGYQDLIVLDTVIWALDGSGTLKSFSSNGDEKAVNLTLKQPITALRTGRMGSIIFSAGNEVFVLDTKSLVYRSQSKLPINTYLLAQDSRGHMWAATKDGLLNTTTNQNFIPDSTLNQYYKWRPDPDASLLDTNDFLWVGFGQGEWGGNLHVFDTKNQRFVLLAFTDPLACLNPVKAFCQIDSQVYMSGSVMHFTTSGCITRFESLQAKHVFNSSWKKNYRTSTYGTAEGEYIGPIAYSKSEKSIYYYSQNGVFKASVAADLSDQAAWQLVFSPRLRWSSGQRDAVGSPMNVRSMTFTSDNKLVLLTQNNGIGIWDGRVFKLIP